MQQNEKGPSRKALREAGKAIPSRRRVRRHSEFGLSEDELDFIENVPESLRLRAAEELSREFDTDISEWLI